MENEIALCERWSVSFVVLFQLTPSFVHSASNKSHLLRPFQGPGPGPEFARHPLHGQSVCDIVARQTQV